MKSGIIALAIIILLTGCRNKQVKTAGSEITPVRVVDVGPGMFCIPVHSTGMLVSSEELKLSFKTGGIVAVIDVREGERVKKGKLLASLNLSEINAQVSLARNGYEKATRDLGRVRNLYADSVATLEQLQNSTTALDMAKSNLDIALFNQSHSSIIAPEDGVILRQFVKTNELVASGYPVFLFGTSGKNWKVKTSLSDRDIVKVSPGDSASLTLDAWPGIIFSAVIDQVGEIANPMTGTYEIELVLTKNSYRLASGFIADVTVYPSVKEKYVMIPIGSIVDADGQTGYAFAVNDSMVVKKIKVEIVTIVGSMAAIKNSIGDVNKIVSEGAAYLHDSEKVKVVEEKTKDKNKK